MREFAKREKLLEYAAHLPRAEIFCEDVRILQEAIYFSDCTPPKQYQPGDCLCMKSLSFTRIKSDGKCWSGPSAISIKGGNLELTCGNDGTPRYVPLNSGNK